MRADDSKRTEREVRRHVDMLAGVIGERNVYRYGALEAAARYVEDTFRAAGYAPAAQEFAAHGKPVRNIEVEIVGSRRPDRIWILGGHYDSVGGSPGADDNATAVAGVLEVARLLVGSRPRDTIRFVAFVNEEPPFYKGPQMGSLVYANRCRRRGERIEGMVNLEMIGFFSDEPGSQQYPYPLDRGPAKWLLPRRGNFIAFCGNPASFWLTRRCNRLFRKTVHFPSKWVAAPERLGELGMSDHWSFWETGYRAVMVTDTAFFRNRHYHQRSDTPDKIDYPRTAKVVTGVAGVMRRLAGGGEPGTDSELFRVPGAMPSLAAKGVDSPVGVIGEGGHATSAPAHPACPHRRSDRVGGREHPTGGEGMVPETGMPAFISKVSQSP